MALKRIAHLLKFDFILKYLKLRAAGTVSEWRRHRHIEAALLGKALYLKIQ
jgi:hypothetical protein